MCEYMIKWFFLNLTSLIPLSFFFPDFFPKENDKVWKSKEEDKRTAMAILWVFLLLLLLLLFHLSFLFSGLARVFWADFDQ
jgi:Na+/proline symporter